MEWLLLIATILYVGQIAFALVGWKRLASNKPLPLAEDSAPVTVIVPFRNEEKHLESLCNDLFHQRYHNKFEVIWVNDHSDDDSVNILDSLIRHRDNHRLISLKNNAGKKAGLSLGIAESKTPFILTVDADVRLPEKWLAVVANEMQTGLHDMLILPVALDSEKQSLLTDFQFSEHLAIQALTFGWAGWNRPISCNGANLAFRRSAFEEVNGYHAHRNTASGDDILLMQSFLRLAKKVSPLMSKEVMVRTYAVNTFNDLWRQRLRWSGKSSRMTHRWARLSGAILMLHSVLWWIAAVTGQVSLFLLLLALIFRIFADVLLIKSVEQWYNQRFNPLKLALISMLYVAYLPLVFVGSTIIKPTWKGRKT